MCRMTAWGEGEKWEMTRNEQWQGEAYGAEERGKTVESLLVLQPMHKSESKATRKSRGLSLRGKIQNLWVKRQQRLRKHNEQSKKKKWMRKAPVVCHGNFFFKLCYSFIILIWFWVHYAKLLCLLLVKSSVTQKKKKPKQGVFTSLTSWTNPSGHHLFNSEEWKLLLGTFPKLSVSSSALNSHLAGGSHPKHLRTRGGPHTSDAVLQWAQSRQRETEQALDFQGQDWRSCAGWQRPQLSLHRGPCWLRAVLSKNPWDGRFGPPKNPSPASTHSVHASYTCTESFHILS